jgi:rubrerythrin
MKTQENLKQAFAGESQANLTYLAYASQAEKEGFPQIANLFRAIAEAETVHAHAHLRAMNGVGTTLDNLKEAAAGEKYEFEEMYPPMVETAEEEGNRRATISMKNAMEVEKVHYELFNAAIAAIEMGEDLDDLPIHVCPVCGHTVIGDAPEVCPVCNAKGEKFEKVA